MKRLSRLTPLLALLVLLAVTVIGTSAQQPGGGGGRGTGGGRGQGRGVPPTAPGQVPARGRGQSQPADRPTFRSATNVVLVDFRAIDGAGRVVRDLSQQDVRVFEDNVEQTITTFRLIDIPIETQQELAATVTAAPPDVVTNANAGDGRLYALVLDDITLANDQFSATEESTLHAPTVRALAREFVERHMGTHDRVAVLTTSGRSDIAAEFTSDRQRLLASIARYEGNYGQERMNPCRNARMKVESLTALAGWLSQIPGRRKAIVLITSRLGSSAPAFADINIDSVSNLGCEGEELVEFVDASARANVATYIIDPMGVPGGEAPGIKPVFVDTPGLYDQSRREGLVAIAETTGGFALVNSNQFTMAFTDLVVQNSSYYMLGYSPVNPERDGRFRRIRVEVGRPGVSVQARVGYVASDRQFANTFYRGNLPPALNETLQSPVPVGGLTMSVSATPLRGNGSRAIVPLLIGLEDAAVRSGAPQAQRPIDLVVAAADKGGSVKDSRRLKVDSQRLLVRLDLNPGRYHLRVAGTDATGQVHGSVLHDIDVPNFTDGRLGMSTLVLASKAESERPMAGFTDEWRRLLKVPPTSTREFRSQDELLTAFEVYDNDNGSAHRVDVTTTVVREDGSVAHRTAVVEERTKGGPKSVTFSRVVTVPLADLRPGSYTLSVEAQSGARADARAVREVPFSIR